MNIILPEIKSVKLTGYSPIFKETIEFDLNELYIILGGNGLGKTTILQSVVYAIAGPANTDIEPEKADRWDRNYFKQRLDDSDNAYIEITFSFGESLILLKRGFNSDSITEFYLNGELITNKLKETNDFFEQFITENAGYNSLQDFNYIIHKLCYLSEKRENLVWDVNAQTRILMRVVSDATKEIQFNNKRSFLKNIDSKKRHLDVDYNRILKAIESAEKLQLPNTEKIKSKDKAEVKKPSQAESIELKIEKLQKDLISQNKILKKDREILIELRNSHDAIIKEVDVLRDQINLAERNYFFKHLNDLESEESKLAIYKLIHNALCPSCGNKSITLQDKAKEYLKNSQCSLCGTEEISELNDNSVELSSKLAGYLVEKVKLEKQIVSIERRMDRAYKEVSNNELKLNQHLLNRKPVIVYIDKSMEEKPTADDIEKLRKALDTVEKERNNKIIEFNKLQKELEKEYIEFNKTNDERIKKLSELYKKYASEFLGIECTLQQGEHSNDKFLNLKLLVPKFNDILRSNPDSCSEAQRFFLDIALRMSFIELSKSLSSNNGTFICETPESALDITYINNVSDMFKTFSFDGGNSLLMSSNIQSGGIAQSLLSEIPQEKKENYFLNMIELGNLSSVQSSDEGIRLFQKEIDKIIKNN